MIAEEAGIPVVAYEGGPHLLPDRPVVAPGTVAAEGKEPKKVKASTLIPEFKDFIQVDGAVAAVRRDLPAVFSRGTRRRA